jgi:hypothetical protein
MSNNPTKYFKRNQNAKIPPIEVRLGSLENDNTEIVSRLIKLMALSEAFTQILIDKNIVTQSKTLVKKLDLLESFHFKMRCCNSVLSVLYCGDVRRSEK